MTCLIALRRFVLIAFIIFCAGLCLPSRAYPDELSSGEPVIFMVEPVLPVSGQGLQLSDGLNISAESAVLIDADTGQVLYAKNPGFRRPIASTTKIMTALLALESGNLDRVVKVSKRAAEVGESSINLKAGEELTLEQLVYGALIRSGNDACVAIAEEVAGSEQNFINLMNYKARWMGALNTSFMNTNGLPAPGHLSTAYDLALLTRHAFQNNIFNLMVGTRTKIIDGPGEGGRFLSNTNKLLWSYEGADGVKTGTTVAAGKCLVASASRDGRRLISVVLHSDNRYRDSIALLDYGFNNFRHEMVLSRGQIVKKVSIREGRALQVPVVSSRDLCISAPVNRPDSVISKVTLAKDICAPVKQGEVAGKLVLMVDGDPVGETYLVAAADIPKLPVHRLVLQRLFNSY